MTRDLPLTRDLVLIGGGHTHALVLRKWGMDPLPGARLTLINPGATAAYSGMLPGFVAGHYSRDDLDIDLVRLARFAGARLIDGAVTGIDPDARRITVSGHPPIAYDVASLDVGITSRMPDLPGFAERGVPAKPLADFASRWDAWRHEVADPCVAVIGGGVAGAELSMAMAHALRTDGHAPQVSLIDRGRALAALGVSARRKMLAALAALKIDLIEAAEVTHLTEGCVHLASGRTIAAGFITGAAGARPHPWLADLGLETEDGFVTVGATLQSSDPAIFAVGDCAHMARSPRPKAGVYAVRQAPVLFDNLCAALSGGTLRRYDPQGDYLKLISLGRRAALAEKFGVALAGPLLWRWKDWIDRRFMTRLGDLPQMAVPPLPDRHAEGLRAALGDKPMCGGCGAKVGRAALAGALSALPAMTRDDVERGAGDDAAVLVTGGQRQVLTTDHLRAFWADPVVMTRIAAVHALGDIWAMGAAPQAATVNLILPRLSPELQRRTMDEILTAAQEVLGGAGAAIVGGHSSLGAELTVGFSLTGLCEAAPITVAGARAGDAIILTKPLGSGTLMAAEMAGQARGADVLAALTAMQQGQGAAARILRGARAMTDVTGFGLAGHLGAICAASGVGARVGLADLPLMAGAEALAGAGVRSSLFADNVAGVAGVHGPGGPRRDLLFDPQTAGGLLACVPSGEAEALVEALRDAGYAQAARIGTVTDSVGEIALD